MKTVYMDYAATTLCKARSFRRNDAVFYRKVW